MLPRWEEEMPAILGQLWLCIAEPILRYLKVSCSHVSFLLYAVLSVGEDA
jgi:hypothetical protein